MRSFIIVLSRRRNGRVQTLEWQIRHSVLLCFYKTRARASSRCPRQPLRHSNKCASEAATVTSSCQYLPPTLRLET